jgi:hypothetical protein
MILETNGAVRSLTRYSFAVYFPGSLPNESDRRRPDHLCLGRALPPRSADHLEIEARHGGIFRFGALSSSPDWPIAPRQGTFMRTSTLIPNQIMLVPKTSFQCTLDTARGHDAKSLEVYAATSLALLRRNQDKQGDTHDILAPA